MEYANIFTIDERKKLISEAIAELRKAKKLSQKEVAAIVGISQATYSAYERGRNEPPVEILVRLSYLYQVPIDIIVQRDRTYRTTDDVAHQMDEYKAQLAELERQMTEGGQDTPAMSNLLEVMRKLADAMTAFSQTETAKKLDIPKQD